MKSSFLALFSLVPLLASAILPSNAVPLLPSQENALISLKTAWRNCPVTKTWVAGADCSKWSGISCDDRGVVFQLYIYGENSCTGALTESVGNLTELTSITISDNWRIYGSLPKSLSNLQKLESLAIRTDFNGGRNSGLSGALPNSIGNFARSLTSLMLLGTRLTGSIPRGLSRLSRLVYLNLDGNRLTGEIPRELSGLRNLVSLEMGGNRLTGSIPPTLAEIKRLTTLHLENNRLSGALPTKEILDIRSLEDLDLRNNRFIASSIAALATHPSLTDIDLSWNIISGSVPEQFRQMKKLAGLKLAGNRLSGTVPVTLLRNMPNLHYLDLSFNRLRGEFPWAAATVT
ncbi:hypothetical protein CLOP_g10905 [Closterium sp. NIES-67]|nr:hypothetical protein CLOP_g10905 [Closterium sp. NIES-67]